MRHLKSLRPPAERLAEAGSIKVRREAFALLSEALLRTVAVFGKDARTLFQLHCPMAFGNRGADWLQKDKDVRNPYFGQQMLKCGEVVKVVSTGEGASREGDRDE
jgi:Cu(I)/Ag(I) efflux system membrane fusion protein